MQPLLAVFVLVGCLVSTACRATSEPAASPEGTWTLVELEGVDVSALARAPELVIGPEGALSGFAGVNRFSGKADTALLGAGRIAAGPMIATRMAGPPDAMEAEQRFLAMLARPLEWRRRGEELELVGDGIARARFVAAD